jgi:hypothetical protein
MQDIKPNQPQPVCFWGGSWIKKSELERQLGISVETGGAQYVLPIKNRE